MVNEKNFSVRQSMHEHIDKMMDKAESMGESGKEEFAHLKEKAAMMKENVDGYIQKNPEKSVLIAAGIGAAVGAVLVAAMMRRKQ
ncbi:hypothetical protein C4573_00570 [Candidatus Woesearchaeota archaeon]|nr:MAG: hypothetical protein C4573_00570 [Candidatus Woesearchaeota archaeon]